MKVICAGVGFGSGTETRRSRDTLYSVSPSCASSWRPTGQNLWFYTKFVLCLYIHYQLCYILASLYTGNEFICIWYLVSILFWPAHHYKVCIWECWVLSTKLWLCIATYIPLFLYPHASDFITFHTTSNAEGLQSGNEANYSHGYTVEPL